MQTLRRTMALGILIGFALAGVGQRVLAQSAAQAYPSRAVHFVVPFAAGGGADVIARFIGAKLAEALGQPVVIENRAGASGNIGTAAAARAAGDGYTILFAYSGTHAINPALYQQPGFRNSDFAPVIMMATVPQVLTVNSTAGARSVSDLIARAKTRPGAMNFASSAAFNQLAAVLFNQTAGVQAVHVPYTGAAASTTALIAGDVAYQFTDPPAVLSLIKSGRVRALAVTSVKRSALFPDLPTLAEAGLEGYDATSWNGVLVPVSTPAPVIARLNAELNKILGAPDVRAKLAELGYDAVGGTPEQFGAYLNAEETKWGKLVKAANLKP